MRFLLFFILFFCLKSCYYEEVNLCEYKCDQLFPKNNQCGIILFIDPLCDRFFDKAEVMINNCLHPSYIIPGEVVKLCFYPELGEKFKIIVRSSSWIFGPIEDLCNEPGDFSYKYVILCE